MPQHVATPQAQAEDSIAAALSGLDVDVALAALVELQAAILSDARVMPGSPVFERISVALLALLAERTAAMGKHLRAGSH